MEVLAAMSVCCLGKHDDHAALFYSCLCCGHALYRLVNILIQWISAICGNHDIGRNRIHTGHLIHESASFPVRFVEISGICTDNFFVLIQYHIYDKSKFCLFCRINHIPMDRIAFQHAGSGILAGDKLGTMVCHDGCCTGYSRQYTFSSTGKTCKKVRFNKSFGNQ